LEHRFFRDGLKALKCAKSSVTQLLRQFFVQNNHLLIFIRLTYQ
jgi:hypothetical protein